MSGHSMTSMPMFRKGLGKSLGVWQKMLPAGKCHGQAVWTSPLTPVDIERVQHGLIIKSGMLAHPRVIANLLCRID